MSLRALRGVAAALVLCTLFACEEEEPVPNPSAQGDSRVHPTTGESWTFLVYMVADNNLEPYALDDLIEMADVGSSAKLNIVVQVDRAQGYDESGLGTLPNWTSTKRLRVMPDALEQLADLGEVNMGDPQTLSGFINWGVKTYPADRYALIFWDHGGAWPGFGGDESTADDDLLTLSELKSGIQTGMRAAGLEQFALIGYDACLMATYEVALAMRPFGEYLLASEELEPGHGWDYRSLSVLRGAPGTDPVALSRDIISGFRAQAVASRTSADITLSLTDLYALDDLVKAVEELTLAYPGTSASSTSATAFGRGRSTAQEYGQMPNPAQSTHMVDLGDLAQQVAGQLASASGARAAISAALAKAVVLNMSGPERSRSTGLSIYFPSASAYYRSDYASLSEVATWRGFLTRLLQGGSTGGVRPTFSSRTARSQADATQVLFQGTLSSGAAEAISRAQLYYGYSATSGNLIFLGERPAEVDSSTSPATVLAAWNYKALQLTQGSRSGYAYLSLAAEAGNISASMPFRYYPPGQSIPETAIRTLIIDSAGNVVQDTYYLLTSGGFGQLSPQPGATLEPLVQIYDTASDSVYFGVVAAGDARFDATQPIDLTFERLAPGTTVFGMLSIEDYKGEGDVAYDVLVAP